MTCQRMNREIHRLFSKQGVYGEESFVEGVGETLIALLGTGICPAIADGDSKFTNEFLDEFGFLVAQVIFLGGIIAQVIKLGKGQFLVLECGCRLRCTPSSGSRAKGKFPGPPADGKGTVDGMVDGKGACGLFGLGAGEDLKKGEGILSGIFRDFLVKDIAHGGKEIRGADGLV